jgi:hypothetical protein
MCCSVHHKIDISSAAKNFTVCAAFGGGLEGAADAPWRAWPSDPRLPALGRRTVVPRGSAPPPSASWRDYQAWRIMHGVAEGDAELLSGGAGPVTRV